MNARKMIWYISCTWLNNKTHHIVRVSVFVGIHNSMKSEKTRLFFFSSDKCQIIDSLVKFLTNCQIAVMMLKSNSIFGLWKLYEFTWNCLFCVLLFSVCRYSNKTINSWSISNSHITCIWWCRQPISYRTGKESIYFSILQIIILHSGINEVWDENLLILNICFHMFVDIRFSKIVLFKYWSCK